MLFVLTNLSASISVKSTCMSQLPCLQLFYFFLYSNHSISFSHVLENTWSSSFLASVSNPAFPIGQSSNNWNRTCRILHRALYKISNDNKRMMSMISTNTIELKVSIKIFSHDCTERSFFFFFLVERKKILVLFIGTHVVHIHGGLWLLIENELDCIMLHYVIIRKTSLTSVYLLSKHCSHCWVI